MQGNLFLVFWCNTEKGCTMHVRFLPDQLFGVILELILKNRPSQTPAELAVALRERLSEKFKAKGEKLLVEDLTAIRDFAGWLAPIGITLHNAWVTREHIYAGHAFSYKLRQDLAPSEERALRDSNCRRDVGEGHPHDVYVVSKTWMHSTESKAPLLCLPVNRRSLVVEAAPRTIMYPNPLTPAEVNNLHRLANLLRGRQYGLSRGADALDAFVAFEADQGYVLPSKLWLVDNGVRPLVMVKNTGSTLFAHLPDTSWDLLATFHRV